MPNVAEEIVRLTQQLLDAIDQRDWGTYAELCDPTLTAFEPEARGHLVEGLPFHAFYLKDATVASDEQRQSSISSPHVRVMGEVAVVSYVRLSQFRKGSQDSTNHAEETRVWQRQEGHWRHVHFHRSQPAS